MAELTLDVARKILDAALAKGVEKKAEAARDHHSRCPRLRQSDRGQDGTSLMRAEIAHGKAYGASPSAWDRGRCSNAPRSRPISSAR
jgi:hypothetical protein